MRETPVDPIFVLEAARIPNARRGSRHPAELPCKIVSHYWDKAVPHHITEVSPYGAWVDTLFPLHPGAQVVVCFTPPGDCEEITVFATVARVVTGRLKRDRKPLGMALDFTDMTPAERTVIENAVAA
jgi:hypothetical protein